MKNTLRGFSLLSIAALALTACGSSADTASSDSTAATDGVIKVVTTTDVYADIVAEVAGDKVEAIPIIASTAVDPHSYEATSQDRLKIKDADMVLLNGGGYDTFMEDMAGADYPDQVIVNAVRVSGLFTEEQLAGIEEEHASMAPGEKHNHVHTYNEHVWYDLDTMIKVTDEVAAQLGKIDPDNATAYTEAADAYTDELQTLLDRTKKVATKERTFIATEPVPAYMLEDAGYTDVTPFDLFAAVETDSDIAPLTMQEAKDILTNNKADLLAFNEQTQTNQTKEIYTFAQDSDVPAASFTETLPEGKNFKEWMTDNIDKIEKAAAQRS